MISSEFRKEARQKLTGKWGKVALISLLYFAIALVIGLLQKHTNGFAQNIVKILGYLIDVPLIFGVITCFVKIFNGEDVKTYDFLSFGFDQFGKAWGIALHTVFKLIFPIIMLLASSFVFSVGSTLLINALQSTLLHGTPVNIGYAIITILGFITLIYSYIYLVARAYYYDLAYIIAAENPKMTSKEAVSRSSRLMFGHRWKLFVLELTFIGWAILAVLTFGIGILWFLPYITFAKISFFKHLKEK